MQQFAAKHPRWGVRKAYWLVRRDGQAVNHKRVQRLWTQAGLQVRPRKHGVYKPPRATPLLAQATRPGEVWSVDFIVDHAEAGSKLRILTIGDDYTRECLAIEVATAFPAVRVQKALARLLDSQATPAYLRSDNGPEFIAGELTAWLAAHNVQPALIEPGHPWQNGVRASFHSRLRDELLVGSVFENVADAQHQIETGRVVYTEVRPHQSINGLTPRQDHQQGRLTPPTTTGN